MSHVYRPGDIVRFGDLWGVVRRSDVDPGPFVDWWVGQYAPHETGEWYTDRPGYTHDLSAPFAHDYAGIPDKVLARSMQIILDG